MPDIYDSEPEDESSSQPEGADTDPETNMEPSGPESEDGDKEDKGAETFLVTTTNFGGKMPKPGDKCTFEVVACHEDECELKYVSDMGGEKKPSAMDAPKNRLMAMAT